MRNRITISFLAEDHDIVAHLQSIREQGQSISGYIRNLIHKDMRGIPNNISIDAVAQAIADKLGAVQIVTNAEKPTVQSEQVDFDEK
ncbi:hypothetical protein [Solibacillus merdavium]|uniref:Uncharacterized protein n=1 Tax=Solibacillus merdavium TaxID=2762218 RepID=A0ABR8XRL6_9BACL|nr:hypothetical protein [Solibacillus merdavium]MBD8034588.1 hypothetical protein [Solibacillus merdavium]